MERPASCAGRFAFCVSVLGWQLDPQNGSLPETMWDK